jgi:phosphoribosylamine---glycine ligase
MRVLLVGSGGREHALAWKLAQSSRMGELHAAPGNPGIGGLAQLHDVGVGDLEQLTELAGRLRADLVVIGPEAPLVAGLADRLRALPPSAPARRPPRSRGRRPSPRR